MKKHVFNCLVIAAVSLGLVAIGCETTGGSTVGGAALGGLAGAVIGHQSGRALEGAAIGAAIGGLAGYAIGKTRETQRLTRAQYEKNMVDSGQAAPQQPVIKIENLQPAPQTVRPGQVVQVNGTYLALGPSNAPPTGTMKLIKDNKVVVESPLDVKNTGYSDFSKGITMPKDAASGNYVVQVDMKHGNSSESKQALFTVA